MHHAHEEPASSRRFHSNGDHPACGPARDRAAAAALKVSRPALSGLLNGKADLSGDMALRIEKAFGVKMDTLMRMQASYDIARTRLREGRIHVRRISQFAEVHG